MGEAESPREKPKTAPSLSGMTIEEAVAKMLRTTLTTHSHLAIAN